MGEEVEARRRGEGGGETAVMVGMVEGSTGCNMVRRGEGEYSSKRIGGVYYEAFAWGRLCTGSSEQAGDSTLVLWAARIKGPPTPPCKASFDPERMKRGLAAWNLFCVRREGAKQCVERRGNQPSMPSSPGFP